MSATRPRLAGVAASPGVAQGPWVEVGRPSLPPPRRIAPAEAASEAARVRDAAKATSMELRELAARVREAGHPAEAAIFSAQAAMARDPDLLDAASAEIEGRGIDGASAVSAAAATVAGRLSELEDELLRGRATDVLDVGDRIARRLAGVPASATLLEPAVIVAEDLAPSITATLPRELVLGLALERSSPTAHAAILARAYGIPAVVGATGLLDAVRHAPAGSEIAIDGETGEVVIAPDAADRGRFAQRAAARSAERARDLAEATAPARTTDGVDVTLLANIGNPDESEQAVALGARGVGLFRTEFLFIERATAPSEDEQTEAYQRVVRAFPGQPVTIRLLDIGGDKPMPYLPLPKEDNPFLGVRALRLADQHPELFVTQLRACYRAAAAGPVRVMAPMVADADDVGVLKALAQRARDELTREGVAVGPIQLGVMLEIPSAVLTAASYFGQLTFASLGTNDLLQYTLAVDRGNPALERYRDALHPALLRLVRLSAEEAERAKISLSVCGEMAGDPVAALALIGLGIRSLSMSATSLPAVRRAIRGAAAAQLAGESQAACFDPSAADARARFTRLAAP
jgi:phosphoenolpyruvate-protein phosphotransferase (PTS system enzyme I)